MIRLLFKLYWFFSGWKIRGRFPHEYKKLMVIVAPHTSWKDGLIGFAARYPLQLEHAHFLGKKELFDGAFGWFFRMLGGTGVDRFHASGVVAQVTEKFQQNDRFILAMAPEGTREKVDSLRSGFYHIAKAAQVPILMVALDFKQKEVVIGPILETSDDMQADFQTILDYFAQFEGAIPSKDLRHLHSEHLTND